MTKTFGPEYEITVNGKTILLDQRKFELLKKIDMYGSITTASKKTKIPYRTALNYIKNIEESVGSGVVYSARGGRGGGGGSNLSALGKQILKEYSKISKVVSKVKDSNELNGLISKIDYERELMHITFNNQDLIVPLREEFEENEEVILLLSPEYIIVMLEPHETSVRNIIPCKITGMNMHDLGVRLNVELDNGHKLNVDITQFSRKKLDLNLEKKIYIGIKAVSISVVKL